VRRAPSCTGALAAALALVGCGAPPADLFSVDRSGEDRNANLRMVVSDGGSVTCNGKQYPLDADRLLTARQLHRDLIPQAQLHLELPPGPQAVLSYRAAMEQGSVAFSDTSARQPESFLRLAAFTKDVAERVCHIIR
jgi:hypothetical protein